MKHAQIERLEKIIGQCKFEQWNLTVQSRGFTVYLVIEAEDTCTRTGKPYTWKSRKWLLSEHMTESEVVQTAFLAVMTAMEHEIREKFQYIGEPIFRPHLDVMALRDLSVDDCIDVRDEQCLIN